MIFLYLILAVSIVEYFGDENFKMYARNGKRNKAGSSPKELSRLKISKFSHYLNDSFSF